MDWIYLQHKETGGHMSVADEPGVVEFYAARGWKVAAEPAPEPFVPPKTVERQADADWVTLYHSGTGASHDFPNNPDALQGAYEVGWHATPPRVVAEAPAESPAAPPKTSPAKADPAT